MNDETMSAAARDHLWMHFTRLSAYAETNVPDDRARRGPVHLGPGRQALPRRALRAVRGAGRPRPQELAEAAAKQAAELAYFPLWSYAHPTAIELADRLADLAPGDLNRVFFTTGGSEAVESAWKLARSYFKLVGKPMKTKAISRAIAYHGTSMGALSITGLPALKQEFEPLVPSTVPGAEHQLLPAPGRRRRYAGGVRSSGPPTGSTRPSSSRARTRSPRSSSSRCRTPAAASRRRPATSSGSARSATGTTCCSSPTR